MESALQRGHTTFEVSGDDIGSLKEAAHFGERVGTSLSCHQFAHWTREQDIAYGAQMEGLRGGISGKKAK